MSRTTCSRCHFSYEGWECPHCAARDRRAAELEDHRASIAADAERLSEQQREHAEDLAERYAEEQEATREAYERSAALMAEATAAAAEKQRESIANSWKLQADAKASRASELYQAKLYAEAIALAKQAVAEDPGNLLPYKTLAWSLEAIGDTAGARAFYLKQLGILGTSDYRNDLKAFANVYAGLPSGDGAIRKAAADQYRKLVPSWDLRGQKSVLGLKGTVGAAMSEEAADLIERISQGSADQDWHSLLGILLEARWLDEARRLVGTWETVAPGMGPFGWMLELGGDDAGRVPQRLATWLAKQPASARHERRKELQILSSSTIGGRRLSAEVMETLMAALVVRRADWAEEVARELATRAAEQRSNGLKRDKIFREQLFGMPAELLIAITFVLAGFVLPGIVFAMTHSMGLQLSSSGCGHFALAAFGTAILFLILTKATGTAVYRNEFRALWLAEEESWKSVASGGGETAPGAKLAPAEIHLRRTTLVAVAILAFALITPYLLSIGKAGGRGEVITPHLEMLKVTETALRMNPAIEVMRTDRVRGTITVREKKTGREKTFSIEDIQAGRLEMGN